MQVVGNKVKIKVKTKLIVKDNGNTKTNHKGINLAKTKIIIYTIIKPKGLTLVKIKTK